MQLTLKKIIFPPIHLTVIILAVIYAVWLLYYATATSHEASQQQAWLNLNGQIAFLQSDFWRLTLSFLFTGLNSLLLVQMNRQHNIIRTRTALPVFIFNILLATWFHTHKIVEAHLSLTFIILAVSLILSAYRNQLASKEVFTASFMLGIATLFFKPLVVLLLVFWLGLILFQSFSLRTWLASLMGLVNPFIFYFTYIYFYQPEQLVADNFFQAWNFSFYWSQASNYEIIYIALNFVILLIAVASIFQNLHNDSIITRLRINFLLILTVVLLLLAVFYSDFATAFLPMIAFFSSILFSHPLSLRTAKFFSILFIVFVVIQLSYIAGNMILQ